MGKLYRKSYGNLHLTKDELRKENLARAYVGLPPVTPETKYEATTKDILLQPFSRTAIANIKEASRNREIRKRSKNVSLKGRIE